MTDPTAELRAAVAAARAAADGDSTDAEIAAWQHVGALVDSLDGISDPTVPTTERALAAVLEHQMTGTGRGEVACGCTPGWMSTYTYYEHLALAVQALYAPLAAEMDRLRAKVPDAWDEGLLAGMEWQQQTNGVPHDPPPNPHRALADPDDTAHPDTEEGR